MCVGDVFEHMVDRSLGRVALSVVAPSSGACRGGQRGAVRQTTAERLVAFGVRTLLIVRVVMRVGNMQDLERRRTFLRWDRRLERRLLDRWEGHFPFVQWIEGIVARITDHEAADLSRAHVHLFQHINHLPLRHRFVNLNHR